MIAAPSVYKRKRNRGAGRVRRRIDSSLLQRQGGFTGGLDPTSGDARGGRSERKASARPDGRRRDQSTGELGIRKDVGGPRIPASNHPAGFAGPRPRTATERDQATNSGPRDR